MVYCKVFQSKFIFMILPQEACFSFSVIFRDIFVEFKQNKNAINKTNLDLLKNMYITTFCIFLNILKS